MTEQSLRLHTDKTLQFLFMFTNANEFYISARYNLLHGLAIVGCINAHQAIELYIKAILRLDPEQEQGYGHKLTLLLKKYKDREDYFLYLLKNPTILVFLKELTGAYLELRYGESGYEMNNGEIVQILDEIAYNLRRIYIGNIKQPSSKLYISDDIKPDFLKDNNFFKETDLTNNILASMTLTPN